MKRYILRATLSCRTAFHLGGLENTPATDRSLARDGQGRLYVPGTSVAGILRALFGSQYANEAQTLFGYQKEDQGQRSALLVDHGYLLPDSPLPEIRDFVRIDPVWGVAEDKHKFDSEVLPAGAKFSLRLEYCDYSGWSEQQQNLAHNAFIALVKILSSTSNLQIGAGFAKGLGRVGVENPNDDLAVWEFSLPDRTAANSYFAFVKWENSLDAWQIQPNPAIVAPLSLNALTSTLTLATPIDIRLGLEATGPFIVSSDEQGDKADREPYQENGHYVVPGSSIRGCLRHRAMRIVNTLLQANGYAPTNGKTWVHVAEEMLQDWFGDTQKASVLGVADFKIPAGAILQEVQSVSIDRFTGGARDGRLFSSYVFWSKSTPLRLMLELAVKQERLQNKDAFLGLLAHVLYDLATEDIAIGHAKTSGHGRVRGLSLHVTGLGDSLHVTDFTQAMAAHTTYLQQIQRAFTDWFARQAGELLQAGNLTRNTEGRTA